MRPLIWIAGDTANDGELTDHTLGPELDVEYFTSSALVLHQLARGRKPGVLLVDRRVPGADELCRLVRARRETTHVPIIVVVDQPAEDSVLAALDHGASDYVARPLDEQDLRIRVQLALRAGRVAADREQSTELQRHVLGIVSHDLRSPLQTFAMGVEGIKLYGSTNPKIMQFVERLEATTLRMRGMIDQLLDVVRAQLGGGIPVRAAEVDLADVARSVLDELAMAYPSAQVESRLASVIGTWDRDRLAQVILNLVGNALQHGDLQSPVWIETAADGPHAAVVRVRNGSSTPLRDEQVARLFAPFRRATGTPSTAGLGLGLYIAREILRAHQGEITVESDATTTTFVVRLPRQAPS